MRFIDKIFNHYKALAEIKQIESLAALDAKITPTALLQEVADVLSQAKLKFTIAGGFARSMHASPRATGDVDIIVAVKDLATTKTILKRAGFKLKDVLDYQKPTRTILKYEFQDRELDILEYEKYPQFVDFLLRTSVTKSLFNTSYSFLGLEGLIVTKLCSFRYKDKADLVDLIDLKPDLALIKSWCSELSIMDRFSFLTKDHSKEK